MSTQIIKTYLSNNYPVNEDADMDEILRYAFVEVLKHAELMLRLDIDAKRDVVIPDQIRVEIHQWGWDAQVRLYLEKNDVVS